MRRTKVSASRLLGLLTAASLLAAPAIARDVTIYGGGQARVVETGDDRPIRVIAVTQDRQTAYQKRVERFTLERKVQQILEARDTDEEVARSDAMLRIIVRGNKAAKGQYSRYFPYHYRSAAFYDKLNRAMREQRVGVRVYRQSILDDVSSEDLQLVAEALNDIN